MAQNYDSVDLNELLEEVNRLNSSGDGGASDYLNNFVQMPDKEGFVVVRILPPVKGKKLYCATRTHRLGTPTRPRNLHCPRELTTINKRVMWLDVDRKRPCPVCKYCRELWDESELEETDKQHSEELKDLYRKIKAMERYYYNAIVRQEVNRSTGATEVNVGPKILSVGKTLHERIVRALVGNPDTDEKPIRPNVLDFKEGRDFKIIKKIRSTGKNKWGNYDASVFLDPSPLGNPDEIKEWLANMHDVAALRVVKSNEDIKVELQKYLGIISQDEDDDTDYNPADFQKSVQTLEQQVDQAKTASLPPVTEEKSLEERLEDAVSGEDMPLDADEILEELRNV